MLVPARLDRIEFVTDAAHVSISEYTCYSKLRGIERWLQVPVLQ